MKSNFFLKSLFLAVALVIGFIAFWEYYWRSKDFLISYNDDKIIWADKRKQVYLPRDEATVFIGGSRIKYDLDIPTWNRLTGEKAIQLAIVGTQAKRVLLDLGNDEKFRGKLVIDVAEPQFFREGDPRSKKVISEALEYYYNETPAQKASAELDFALESKMVFLEEGRFGLNSLLNQLMIPNRSGLPPVQTGGFKKESVIHHFDRQALFSPRFLRDTALLHAQILTWKKSVDVISRAKVIEGDTLNIFFRQLQTAIDKIRARGGTVVFVRPPSSGDYKSIENKKFPRQQYWDQLLIQTHTPGIHYTDYPGMAGFICLEMSHLAPRDAIKFTEELVNILKEKGWFIPNKQASLTKSTITKNEAP